MENKNIIGYKFCNKFSKIPLQASNGSAGYDLYSVEKVTLIPGSRITIKTGLCFELPEFIYASVLPRSSLSLNKKDVYVGTIDSDYRGEVCLIVGNNSDKIFDINIGDRIGQIIFKYRIPIEFKKLENLDKTERGEKGFGSTGLNDNI